MSPVRGTMVVFLPRTDINCSGESPPFRVLFEFGFFRYGYKHEDSSFSLGLYSFFIVEFVVSLRYSVRALVITQSNLFGSRLFLYLLQIPYRFSYTYRWFSFSKPQRCNIILHPIESLFGTCVTCTTRAIAIYLAIPARSPSTRKIYDIGLLILVSA